MFAKARVTRTPVFRTSEKMFQLMNTWDLKSKSAEPVMAKIKSGDGEISDSTRLKLADDLFSIGRVHEELGNMDSVKYYFGLAVEYAPLKEPESSRYYYSYSRVMRDSNAFLADSLLDIIVMNHPLTEFGKDAQSQLGYTSNFVVDTVADLYTSGLNLMRHGDYNYSIEQFSKVYGNYPASKFSPPSIYTIGWIYEKYLKLPDSALAYYKILLDNYPESEHAKEVNLSVAYKMAVNSGEEIPDSLKTRKVVIPKQQDVEKGRLKPQRKQVNKKQEPLDPRTLINNPGAVLENPGGLMSNPLEMLKELEFPPIPNSPLDVFKHEALPQDSTKAPVPEKKEEIPEEKKPE